MALSMNTPDFLIERNINRCINCQVCVRQCANEAHRWDAEEEKVTSDDIPVSYTHLTLPTILLV